MFESGQKPAMLEMLKGRGNPLSRTKVLLADDNTAIMDHVSHMLREEFDIIGKVTDGDCVCAEVEKLRPDLVVLDICMPERSGIQICQQLREQGYAGEIVFLTALADADFVNAAIGAGGRGYVTKARMNTDLALALNAALLDQVFISSPLQ